MNQLNAVSGESMAFVFNTLPIGDDDLCRVKWAFEWVRVYVIFQWETDFLAMSGCLD